MNMIGSALRTFTIRRERETNLLPLKVPMRGRRVCRIRVDIRTAHADYFEDRTLGEVIGLANESSNDTKREPCSLEHRLKDGEGHERCWPRKKRIK